MKRSSAPCIASLLVLFGCVNLDKPENVQRCASTTQGCSDNRDANPATQSDALADKNGATDLGRDQEPDSAVAVDGQQPDRVAEDGASLDADTVDLVLATDVPVEDAPFELDAGEPDLPAVEVALQDAAPVDVPPVRDVLLDVTVDQTRLDTVPANCIQQIIDNGYKAPPALPCSVCNDGNGGSLASKCTGMLDCLEPLGSSSFILCLNRVSGSSRVSDCVNALTRVACPNGY